jgi:hypothetical protein
MKEHFENNPETMDMPCLCDCSQWFDLNNGYQTKKYNSQKLICRSCHKKEDELEDKILDLESESDHLEYMNKKPKTVEKMRKQAQELREKLYY